MSGLPEWAEALVEPMALAIMNSDRVVGGWPPLASRENVPNSEGYVRNARAALAVALPMIGGRMAGVVEGIDTFDRDVTVSAAGAMAITLAAHAIREECR